MPRMPAARAELHPAVGPRGPGSGRAARSRRPAWRPVAIQLGNGVDWVLAFFGAILADAIVVPVNTRFTETEADYVVTDSGATYVFTPGAALPDGDPLVVDERPARPAGRDTSTPAARASPRAP